MPRRESTERGQVPQARGRIGATGTEGSLAAGRDALLRAAWAEARAQFDASLAVEESVEALEGLGAAARWQMDGPVALAAHERAYRLAREDGDEEAAARLAIELTFDCGTFRGSAETSGWLERAGQLLERLPPLPEHAIRLYLCANGALNGDHDPQTAATLAAEGVGAARAASSVDHEMVCLALEGLALVALGAVPAGMRRLDAAAAAAVAGEVASVRIIEVICCHLIDACERVRDLERAGEWCMRVEEIASRYEDAEMFATCRTHYSDLLVWRGDWHGAERTLTTACRELGGVPHKVVDGMVRLAELRRRQGRREQAEALLAEAEGHRLALLVRAELALDCGEGRAAAELAERFLRRVGEADRFERVRGLELAVRARLALGDEQGAREALAELEDTAAAVGTAPMRAAALLARGRVESRGSPEAARPAIEDAVDLYRRCEAPYEAAQARSELAAVLGALGRDDDAARADADARAALAVLGAPAPRPRRGRPLLSTREREVLRLLAQGSSNETIADALVISVRTVERHVENVYDKIGVSGRTARAAATAWALKHGIG
jgi:DNA-binding NarL/FixJ family response regulator